MNPTDAAAAAAATAHHFTSGEWSLLITVLLTGFTTMAVTIIGAIKGATNGRKMDDTKAHLEKQDDKIDTIHTQTNGNLAAVQTQLEVSRREVAELKAAAAAKAEAAAELAAERARHQSVLIADRRTPQPARRRATKARKGRK